MDVYETSKEVVRELLSSEAEIAVIGGWAIWAYNPYKYSMDIDVVTTPGGLWKIREKLQSLGFNETSGGHLGKKGFKKALEDGTIEVDVYEEKIGPFTAEEVLKRSQQMDLFGIEARVASPTDLAILKVHALSERRESGKGQKDVSDLIALLLKESKHIDSDVAKRVISRKVLRETISLITSSYQCTSKFYPLSMDEYRKLKSTLERWAV
jgi:predicted nucleotidyltransferase